MNFIVNYLEYFQETSVVYNINAKNKYELHRPLSAFHAFRKYADIRIVNSLLLILRSTVNSMGQFKIAVKVT
jgi:hypothetical protein